MGRIWHGHHSKAEVIDRCCGDESHISSRRINRLKRKKQHQYKYDATL